MELQGTWEIRLVSYWLLRRQVLISTIEIKFGYSEKATKFEKIFHLQFLYGTVNLRLRCEARLLVVYVGLSAEADVCQLTGREKVDL